MADYRRNIQNFIQSSKKKTAERHEKIQRSLERFSEEQNREYLHQATEDL